MVYGLRLYRHYRFVVSFKRFPICNHCRNKTKSRVFICFQKLFPLFIHRTITINGFRMILQTTNQFDLVTGWIWIYVDQSNNLIDFFFIFLFLVSWTIFHVVTHFCFHWGPKHKSDILANVLVTNSNNPNLLLGRFVIIPICFSFRFGSTWPNYI